MERDIILDELPSENRWFMRFLSTEKSYRINEWAPNCPKCNTKVMVSSDCKGNDFLGCGDGAYYHAYCPNCHITTPYYNFFDELVKAVVDWNACNILQKPCPKCGSWYLYEDYDEKKTCELRIECLNCGYRSLTYVSNKRKEAIKAWNENKRKQFKNENIKSKV